MKPLFWGCDYLIITHLPWDIQIFTQTLPFKNYVKTYITGQTRRSNIIHTKSEHGCPSGLLPTNWNISHDFKRPSHLSIKQAVLGWKHTWSHYEHEPLAALICLGSESLDQRMLCRIAKWTQPNYVLFYLTLL